MLKRKAICLASLSIQSNVRKKMSDRLDQDEKFSRELLREISASPDCS